MSFHVVFYGLKVYFGLNISLHCTKMIVFLVEVLIMSLKLWNIDHDGGGLSGQSEDRLPRLSTRL
jgi:hypothetical protein